MLKVLGRETSINVRKVLWCADELGLSYEREDWGMPGRDPRVPEFMALNPNAQLPVILDEDFVLWESNTVMRYLCEKDGRGTLLPADLRERALCELLAGTVDLLVARQPKPARIARGLAVGRRGRPQPSR